MDLYSLFVFFMAFSYAQSCCSECHGEIANLNLELEQCLQELEEKGQSFRSFKARMKPRRDDKCTSRMSRLSTTLQDCLESLCAEPEVDPKIKVNVSVTVGTCSQYAYSVNPFHVALAKLSGTNLKWMSPFSEPIVGKENGKTYYTTLELAKSQIGKSTHVLIDISGSDDLFITKINVATPYGPMRNVFSQPDESNCYRWVTGRHKSDKDCNDYFKTDRTITIFGTSGVEHVINVNDLEKLKKNQLIEYHRRCNAC
ncbi:hypothetical protein L596_030456 [Steinernema carpocapsae]|uniref:Uncharacterized protein n=1 Tax=Steinernema carpocapsae TaxID=34508 RepID=A0A4U5LPG1_STECR|nr:hypothetical protein L596_030456 [Steinernema carpocapsae]